jgi:hypothetical protein
VKRFKSGVSSMKIPKEPYNGYNDSNLFVTIVTNGALLEKFRMVK